MPKAGKKGDSLFSTTKEIRGWSIWNLSGIYLPLGQNLRRYIAAQSLTRLATQKPPQTLRLAGVPGAGNVTRTHDLLITNRIRCKNLGKMGLFSPFAAAESSGQHSFPEYRHTHIFRCGSERGSTEEKDRISYTSNFELQ